MGNFVTQYVAYNCRVCRLAKTLTLISINIFNTRQNPTKDTPQCVFIHSCVIKNKLFTKLLFLLCSLLLYTRPLPQQLNDFLGKLP